MKINDGFSLRKVADSYVIIPVGDNLVDFSAMITINETGAFLWEKLKDDTTADALTDALCAEYDVTAEEAASDVADFVKVLKDKKVLS